VTSAYVSSKRSVLAFAAIALASATLAACDSRSGSSAAPPTSRSRAAIVRVASPPVCVPADGSEVSAEHHPAPAVWALVFSSARPDYRVGQSIKVVWHAAGSGPPKLLVVRPTGAHGALDFGPKGPRRSSYHRPGDEYGSGFTPDAPGCWQFSLRRGDVGADLRFDVHGAAA
jgi:hypothetical protein